MAKNQKKRIRLEAKHRYHVVRCAACGSPVPFAEAPDTGFGTIRELQGIRFHLSCANAECRYDGTYEAEDIVQVRWLEWIAN